MTDFSSDVSIPAPTSEGAENPYKIGNLPEAPVLPHSLSSEEMSPSPEAAPEYVVKPQPGVILGFLMAIGFPASQMFTAIPALIAVMVMGEISGATRMTTLLAGSQAGVLLAAIGLAAACTWLAKHKVFNFAPIRLLHLVALVAVILPTTMLSRACYDIALIGWTKLVTLIPSLQFMDNMNTMAQVGDIVSQVPFPFLLFGMAIVPALAEEIVFRGIIGRGLTARYGMVSGILLTSIMFGIAHVHPAHAVSVIPLGIMFHVLYVTTRSFWAPVLAHFFNNAFAVVGATIAARQGQNMSIDEAPGLPWWVALAALISVAAWFALLFKTRTRLVTQTGTDWSPGYESTETPRHTPTRRLHEELPLGATLAALFGGALFFAAFFGFAIMEGMKQMNAEQALILLLR